MIIGAIQKAFGSRTVQEWIDGMSESKAFLNNFIWRFFERIGAQGVTFVVSIVLARLLDPAVYGTIALVTVFTSLMQVFIDSGLGNALIQKKDADDLDFSSVFYFNMIACLCLYAIMFCIAPAIAKFYDNTELVSIIRVLSLSLVLSGLKNIQQAYVSRRMMFRKFFFSTLAGTIGAGVLGIWMAYRGFGVWALVMQDLFNAAAGTVILWITVKWRPKLKFSFERLKGLLSYGWKLLFSSLLDVGYRDLRSLAIGKIYSSEDLAFYNRGSQFPMLIVTNVNTSIDSVLFPIMSKEQNNRSRIYEMTRRSIKISSYIIMPLMVGLAVCAEPIIRILLTEKWLPCVLYLRIFCFTYAFYPINVANLNAIKALGRSDMFLKLEILKKVVGFSLLFATMYISVEAMAYSLLVSSVASLIINAWPNSKLLNYHLIDQVRDLFPSVALSAIMGTLVYCVTFLPIQDYFILTIQVLLGVTVYVMGSILFHLESFSYCISVLKEFKKK